MAFDGLMLHVVTENLKQELYQGRINKVYAISNYELLFNIRSNRENKKLLISCHPMYARIQLTNLKYDTPANPKQFVMLLRKYLEGSHIAQIEQIGLERILKFTIYSRNELGDLETLYMFVEIMGKHSNFILCNRNLKIIDCLKHISPSMNTVRFVQPGAIYELPPLLDKINPLENCEVSTNNYNKTYQGIAPVVSKEILYQNDQGYSFKEVLDRIVLSQSIYITRTDNKEYFYLIPLTYLNAPFKEYSLYDGLDAHFASIDTKERIKQQTSDLEKYVQNEYTKNVNKLAKLEQTLDESTNSEELRIKGDLLFASLHLIEKGMTSVEVDNYYDNTKMLIELDPRFDGKTNAKRYYNRYQKAKNSLQVLNEQIEKTLEEIEYFDTLSTQLMNASYNDAIEMKEELEELGYLHKHKKKGLQPKKKHPAFETYTTKDGIEIYIGKNNLQNEYLTFKFANKNYLWFHAKDMPGSHLVVNQSELDEYTMRLCATLAAYFSKGKNSSSVPVNYCQVRNLKKINGGLPGKVILSTYNTIYIDPEEAVLEEITKKGN